MSDKKKPITGGCTCGAVRYHAQGPSVLVELCHCRICEHCGTSLALADIRFPDEIYVSVGSFDDAEGMSPEFHIWRSHRLSWLETSDGLPRFVQFKADGILEEKPGQS